MKKRTKSVSIEKVISIIEHNNALCAHNESSLGWRSAGESDGKVIVSSGSVFFLFPFFLIFSSHRFLPLPLTIFIILPHSDVVLSRASQSSTPRNSSLELGGGYLIDLCYVYVDFRPKSTFLFLTPALSRTISLCKSSLPLSVSFW